MGFLDNLNNKVRELNEWRESIKIIADSELAQQRFEICKSCEYYTPNFNKCRYCGCLLGIKTKFEHFHCPLKKW